MFMAAEFSINNNFFFFFIFLNTLQQEQAYTQYCNSLSYLSLLCLGLYSLKFRGCIQSSMSGCLILLSKTLLGKKHVGFCCASSIFFTFLHFFQLFAKELHNRVPSFYFILRPCSWESACISLYVACMQLFGWVAMERWQWVCLFIYGFIFIYIRTYIHISSSPQRESEAG